MIGNHVYPQGYRGFESRPLRRYFGFRSLRSGCRPFVAAHRLPRVQECNRVPERARRQVHVPKRHAQRRVSGELLNRLWWRSTHREMRAERVPKDMRTDPAQPCPLRAVPERGLDRRLGERTPVALTEDELASQVRENNHWTYAKEDDGGILCRSPPRRTPA